MHGLSLIAPQQPRNAMKKTIPPTTIKITGADHISPMNESKYQQLKT